MTDLTETEYLVAALESGGVDYVTKPIKPKEVLARELLERYCGTQAPTTPEPVLA
jgi:DNA-binding response OmpR family regulator